MYKVNEKIIHKITGEIFTIESIDVYNTITLIFTTCKKYIPIDEISSYSLISDLFSDIATNLEKIDNELIKFIDNLEEESIKPINKRKKWFMF
jgi:hypothetical protein